MIKDLNDERLLSYAFAVRSGETKEFSLLIECNTGYYLRGSVVAGLALEAKHNLSGTWVDLETTPIDLSGWDGTDQEFDFRVTAGTITARDRVSFNISVGI